MEHANYNKFCENKQCENYKEWYYQEFHNEPPYRCVSCTKIGQSYNIDQYPKDCNYKKDILEYKVTKRTD